MTAVSLVNPHRDKSKDPDYKKRIRAWVLYDWANSAFVTTVMAAVLPAYYSSVAGATLPSSATATAYWSITNSIAVFIAALISPILGTISDVMRGKKVMLAIFTLVGVIGTGMLVFVGTGDWVLASLALIIGRIGLSSALIFYDSLLQHVADDEDEDKVSTQGYALGYLGGGILLAINVAMIFLIPTDWLDYAGIRLSFLSVALWWAVFSIPLFRDIPEPPAPDQHLKAWRWSKKPLGACGASSRIFNNTVNYLNICWRTSFITMRLAPLLG